MQYMYVYMLIIQWKRNPHTQAFFEINLETVQNKMWISKTPAWINDGKNIKLFPFNYIYFQQDWDLIIK